tara:strand:- start:1155 stop:1406 length:252 start_codon:yes stop_codon:yes gene_type:complete
MNQQAPNARHAATAQAMDAAGKEIAAILAERIFAGEGLDCSTEAVGGLLTAAYHLALVVDGPDAKPNLAALLRRFADTIENSE